MGKRNYNQFIALFFILLLGFVLRSYNLNFPSIGYHNTKENEYLCVAQVMQKSGDYITRRVYFYDGLADLPQFKLYPQLPLISYQILLSWRLLGENLWGPRLINVLFGLFSIVTIYYLARILFADVIASLFCAFLLAVMPLAVFFSRNLQPECPAFFFMLLGNLFYLKFSVYLRRRDLFFGGLAFVAASLYKISFLTGVVPLFFCFPYRTLLKDKKELFKTLFAYLSPYLLTVISLLWLILISHGQADDFRRVNMFEIFTSFYWQEYGRMMWWYVQGENFTIVFTLLAILGILIAILLRRDLAQRYLTGWAFLIIPYCIGLSDFINQHCYYQMPFLPLVCVAVTFALLFLSKLAAKKKRNQAAVFILLAAAAIAAASPLAYLSIKRMYGTVFWGMDVAGESLKEFTAPGERVFLLSHVQKSAIARYAERYTGWVSDLAAFQEKEKKFKIRYICAYPPEYLLRLKFENPELYNYIDKNYFIKEAGLVQSPHQVFYLILEKSRPGYPAGIKEDISGPAAIKTIYRIFGHLSFFYVIRPSAG